MKNSITIGKSWASLEDRPVWTTRELIDVTNKGIPPNNMRKCLCKCSVTYGIIGRRQRAVMIENRNMVWDFNRLKRIDSSIHNRHLRIRGWFPRGLLRFWLPRWLFCLLSVDSVTMRYPLHFQSWVTFKSSKYSPETWLGGESTIQDAMSRETKCS